MTDKLRVLHQQPVELAPDRYGQYAESVRASAGAEEAEAYTSLDGSTVALVELWEDQASYAAHWAEAVADRADDLILHTRQRADGAAKASEFYAHQPFMPGEAWTAGSLAGFTPAVVWPARGPVRVLLQLGLEPSEDLRQQLIDDEIQTSLEHGCGEYRWLQSVDVPEHFLLLEQWESQTIYDHHWHLRIKTGSASGEMPMTERKRGTAGIEFYRQQEFVHLYDRWLPAVATDWAETVVWPN